MSEKEIHSSPCWAAAVRRGTVVDITGKMDVRERPSGPTPTDAQEWPAQSALGPDGAEAATGLAEGRVTGRV